MAGRRYLLDCTLRDGGYINDWKFGKDNLINVFERVTDAGVDVIEIGFWMIDAYLTKIEV